MPNLGMPEILLILVVALLVFGPRKLPEMGKSIGEALREFRKHTSAVTSAVTSDFRTDLATPVTAVAAQPHAQVTVTSSESSLTAENIAPGTAYAAEHSAAQTK